MRALLAITQKELRAYFASPVAYVVAAVFLLVSGFLYYSIVTIVARQTLQFLQFQGMTPQLSINEMILRPTYRNMTVILVLITPILTMRLFAEERKSRTIELLMTSPISITTIVVGKYVASLIIYLLMLTLTVYMPILMALFGSVEWGPILSGYLGLFLIGSVFIAVGLFASTITENQIIAASVSFGLLLVFWLLGWAAMAAGSTGLGQILAYLSFFDHLDNFMKGIVDASDVTYFLSLIAFGLFLAHRVVESQRWV